MLALHSQSLPFLVHALLHPTDTPPYSDGTSGGRLFGAKMCTGNLGPNSWIIRILCMEATRFCIEMKEYEVSGHEDYFIQFKGSSLGAQGIAKFSVQ